MTIEEWVSWLEQHGIKHSKKPYYSTKEESASEMFERMCTERGIKVTYANKIGTNSITANRMIKKK